MNDYRYRILSQHEESEGERLLCEKALKVFSKKLGLRNVALHFIAPDISGEIVFDEPIGGACPPGGDKIFVRRGLPLRDMITVVVHELRHCYQKRRGTPRGTELREQDCRIYELEVDVPPDKKICRWLVEQEFELSEQSASQ